MGQILRNFQTSNNVSIIKTENKENRQRMSKSTTKTETIRNRNSKFLRNFGITFYTQ